MDSQEKKAHQVSKDNPEYQDPRATLDTQEYLDSQVMPIVLSNSSGMEQGNAAEEEAREIREHLKVCIESHFSTYRQQQQSAQALSEPGPSVLRTSPALSGTSDQHSVLHSMRKAKQASTVQWICIFTSYWFFFSSIQELQVLKDCQENLEKRGDMEFWELRDCKD